MGEGSSPDRSRDAAAGAAPRVSVTRRGRGRAGSRVGIASDRVRWRGLRGARGNRSLPGGGDAVATRPGDRERSRGGAVQSLSVVRVRSSPAGPWPSGWPGRVVDRRWAFAVRRAAGTVRACRGPPGWRWNAVGARSERRWRVVAPASGPLWPSPSLRRAPLDPPPSTRPLRRGAAARQRGSAPGPDQKGATALSTQIVARCPWRS